MVAVSLNDLPENIIFEILCRLPIRDLARTCILSHFWRHRWHSVPDLNIYGLCHSQVMHVLNHHSIPIRLFKAHYYREEELEEEADNNDFKGGGEEEGYNDLNQGEVLNDFLLEEEVGEGGYDYRGRGEMESWLTTLSRHSSSTLSTLTLEIMYEQFDIDIEHVARCLPNLASLSVYGSVEYSPKFHGFSLLRDLHIDGCISGSISRLISSCPLLQTAYLHQGVSNDTTYSLHIVAPRLRWLTISGFELYEFSIITAPVLETASISCDFCDFNTHFDFTSAFQNLASIKKLTLGKQLLQLLGRGDVPVPERLPINLGNLKFMSLLVYFEDVKQILVTLCLLSSSPNLKELKLQMKYTSYHFNMFEPSDDFWMAQEHEDLFHNLETITLSDIKCKKVEMDFIKFLLAKAEALKTFEIKFGSNIEKKDTFMMELMEFPKISNQAQILCSKVCSTAL